MTPLMTAFRYTDSLALRRLSVLQIYDVKVLPVLVQLVNILDSSGNKTHTEIQWRCQDLQGLSSSAEGARNEAPKAPRPKCLRR